MKRKFCCLLLLMSSITAFAQLSGVISVPSTSYSSLASLLTSLNLQGVSGPLTINIAAGYVEQAPIGGFSLTTSGSMSNPIVFQKSGTGASPLIIAYAGGNGTPGSMNQDGIWRLIGSDFITIDGIALLDTNVSNPSTMEFGFGFFKANAGNGCWNNTIKNCSITLNRINNATGSGPSEDGSRAIDVVNAYSNVHNAAVTVTALTGSHSFNHFYGNHISNCNIGFSLVGFNGSSPYNFCDHANEVGGASIVLGNQILNFGGGGTVNACAGIKTLAQYDLLISHNVIQNNSGLGINHASILKGIQTLAASEAEVSIVNNSLTLNSAGTNNQLVMIENTSGSNGTFNKVLIQKNLFINCSYTSAVSPSYYGIWNTASPSVLAISQNSFVNNSSNASGGSTYLIYNNGAVADSIFIESNKMGFIYGNSLVYSGTMYAINNNNGSMNSFLSISKNTFEHFFHLNAVATGNFYFIYNTNNSHTAHFDNNRFKNIKMNQSGSHYLIYNSSATQSLLSVCQNSILGSYERLAASGPMYGFYGNGNSSALSTHSICENNFSNILSLSAGSGLFYGIYDSDGNTSPYPRKIIANNKIANISMNSSGTFYGYYLDALGDANGINNSEVHHNELSAIMRSGSIYGFYLAPSVSPSLSAKVYQNRIFDLTSNGATSTIYFVYMNGNGAGISFFKNKLMSAVASGTTAVVNGVYVNSTVSTTLSNNNIGDLSTPNSIASNAINGIYINSAALVHVFYNSVFLNATSTGGNFNSNALFSSSTASLNLQNTILYNTSSGGTGITAAYRRSSTSLATYSSSSNTNLFYAGTPNANHVLLQGGSASYQTLGALQTAISPRDAASVTQTLSFLSSYPTSPNYLHITPNVSNLIESAAQSLGSVNEDIDAEIRQGVSGYLGSGSSPDIGSDEFELNVSPCISVSPSIITPSALTLCANSNASFTAIKFSGGTGVQFQWKISGNPAGPFVNTNTGSGSTASEYLSPSLSAGTYYYLLETSCNNLTSTAVSQIATVQVNPIPSVSAAVLSSLVCEGQSISLMGTSSISGEFQWLGPNGFVSDFQNPVLQNVSALATGNYSLNVIANECSSNSQSVVVNVSTLSLSLVASPQLLCAGNSCTLSLNTNATTYAWSNGSASSAVVVSPSVTSVFSVIVTNSANCSKTASLTLPLITPSIQSNGAVICGNSGTVILSVNAFTPSTIYWYNSPTSNNVLQSGNSFSLSLSSDSTVYAQASHSLSGCQSIRIPVSATLSAYPNLTLTSASLISCPGTPNILYVTGASTYSWVGLGSGSTKTVNISAPSTFTVIGKNSFGCSSTKTISIFTHPTATLLTQQSATVICPSSIVQFTAAGANSYTWNTGAIGSVTTVTPAANSIYTVYGTNVEGCVSSKTISVNTRSVPVIEIEQSSDSICPGEVIMFTASGANSYTWLPSGNTANTFSIQLFNTSVINAIGKSVNSCTNLAYALIQVDPCTNIKNEVLETPINVFPNPVTDHLFIRVNSVGKKELTVYDLLGKKIYQTQFNEFELTLDISEFSKGFYLLHVEKAEQVNTIKFLKN